MAIEFGNQANGFAQKPQGSRKRSDGLALLNFMSKFLA
jgi:hypothetical protein